MDLSVTVVDAFTARPFTGNPAAVCLLPAPRSDEWMQLIAREMNLSETAFLLEQADGFGLRWFTPTVEVELCGHATLASAHVLWERKLLGADAEARFHTRSGLLTARRTGALIELNFPADPATATETAPDLREALGTTPEFIGRSRCCLLIELASAEAVRNLKPDCTWLSAITSGGVIVTAAADAAEGGASGGIAAGSGSTGSDNATTDTAGVDTAGSDHPRVDFVSRFFAPALGIDEDPVTGAAHCCLAPYWAQKLGRTELVGHQVSARGGIVRMRLEGDRVVLGGEAVTVLHATLSEAALG